MARTAVAVRLLVVASILAVASAAVVAAAVAPGGVVGAPAVDLGSTGVGHVTSGGAAPVVPDDVAAPGRRSTVTGGVAAAVRPGVCNTGPSGRGDRPNFTFVPDRTSVGTDEAAVLLVCIANPADSTAPLDVSLVVAHDGRDSDATVLLVGPDVGPSGNATQRVAPLDTRMRGGRGHFVSPGELQPGTGALYVVVVEPGMEPGEYEFEAEIEWRDVDVEQLAVLRVERHCGVGCHLGRAAGETVAVLAAGVAYLESHPGDLIKFVGVLVSIAGLVGGYLGSAWLRSRLGLGSDGDESPDRGTDEE